MKFIDNSAKTNWTFVVIVTTLGLLVGGGIWWYTNLPEPQSDILEISPIPSASLQSTSGIDTSTWQTYRNAEFGFEVKYPKNFVVREADLSFVKRDGGVFGTEISDQNSSNITLHISVIRTGLPPRTWLEEHYTAIPPGYNDVYAGHYSTPRDIFVNGIPAIQFNLFFASGSLRSTLIQKDFSVLYHVAAGSGSLGSFPQETYDQILSTFRFIGLTYDTSTWQTYRNDEYGFEVKYPEDTAVVTMGGSVSHSGENLIAKLISAYRKERLGKEECSYGERGFVETCRIELEDGISFGVLPEEFAEIRARFGDLTTRVPYAAREEVIGGRTGVYTFSNFEFSYLNEYYYIPLERGKTLLIESAATGGFTETGFRYSPSRESVNQILSTFRFIE